MSRAEPPAGAYTVRAEGRGRVELPAYGMADAEHQVEKELLRAWPDARTEVLEVIRAETAGRIVEEFRVAYRVSAAVSVEASSPDEAKREALRRLRAAFEGTRYRRIEWAKVEVSPA
ncbi:MAG TPA: hypothetical protein VHG28_04690 [Longimicrobiaceae bacterium]|nr:hypothetical protein [Longimicrobiaceae bacterium]